MMAVVIVRALAFCIFSLSIAIADCNSEGDTLFAWRENLADPNGVLQSWDATLINPCTWFHVTCNSDNMVTRIDLGNAGLSGPLLPELGKLSHLQYLNVYENNISGTIPAELGNLTRLINLDLHQNELSGSIPSSLGNLRYLRWMRLNSNKLSGEIPLQVVELIRYGHLSIMNVSDNNLAASVRRTKSRGFATTTVIQDPRA